MTPRDSQRQRLYDAEEELECHQTEHINTANETPANGMTLQEIERFVDKAIRSAWFRRRWRLSTTFRIGDGRGARRATYQHAGRWYQKNGATSYEMEQVDMPDTLKFPKWARQEIIVIHELAHWCVHGRYRPPHSEEVASHGREYANIFLELVGHFMGSEVRAELVDAFKRHRVKWRATPKMKEITGRQMHRIKALTQREQVEATGARIYAKR